ncbi:unnamed protein product, partial [marine sediment metagenome]
MKLKRFDVTRTSDHMLLYGVVSALKEADKQHANHLEWAIIRNVCKFIEVDELLQQHPDSHKHFML